MLMEFARSEPLTIGMELELQLLARNSLELVEGILPLMEVCPDNPHIKPEFIQNTVEITSKVCHNIDELETHMRVLTSELLQKCDALGMRLAAAGTHPFSQSLALITPLPRYLRMESRAGLVAHTQVTFATHVHLGMTSGDEAIRMMRALKPYLPLLMALSASSPYWRGYDTGYACYRQRILAASRSYGVPPGFRDWAQFCHFFETTRRAGLFESVNDIHWDLRPRPKFGTLEIRVMDAQPTVAEAVGLASFLRVLVQHLMQHGVEAAPGLPQALPWWLEKENHFQASRLAMASQYVAHEDGTVKPLRAVWEAVAAAIEPTAAALGEGKRLRALDQRVDRLSYVRQREVYRRAGSYRDVVDALSEELRGEAQLTPCSVSA
jgi:carboxylate-amine ligase